MFHVKHSPRGDIIIPLRVAVVGSRCWRDWRAVNQLIFSLDPDSELVTGGAIVVDSMAEVAARKRGLRVTVVRPQYAAYG